MSIYISDKYIFTVYVIFFLLKRFPLYTTKAFLVFINFINFIKIIVEITNDHETDALIFTFLSLAARPLLENWGWGKGWWIPALLSYLDTALHLCRDIFRTVPNII